MAQKTVKVSQYLQDRNLHSGSRNEQLIFHWFKITLRLISWIQANSRISHLQHSLLSFLGLLSQQNALSIKPHLLSKQRRLGESWFLHQLLLDKYQKVSIWDTFSKNVKFHLKGQWHLEDEDWCVYRKNFRVEFQRLVSQYRMNLYFSSTFKIPNSSYYKIHLPLFKTLKSSFPKFTQRGIFPLLHHYLNLRPHLQI